jgi:hypothetical protein
MDRITHQSPRQRGYGSTSSLRNDSLKHTRKHERRREESNQGTKLPGSGGLSGQVGRTVRNAHADSPTRCRRQSARTTRTVRPEAPDRPLKPIEPPERTREKQTVREGQADRPRGFRTVRCWSSDRPQTGCNENLKQNRIKPKQNKNTKNTTTNWAELALGGQSAGGGRTVRQFKTEQEKPQLAKSTPPTHHRISQTVEAI